MHETPLQLITFDANEPGAIIFFLRLDSRKICTRETVNDRIRGVDAILRYLDTVGPGSPGEQNSDFSALLNKLERFVRISAKLKLIPNSGNTAPKCKLDDNETNPVYRIRLTYRFLVLGLSFFFFKKRGG